VPVVSVDLPSGVSCDTGEELGDSVWAVRTVTFGLPKPFLFQGTGLEHAGHWTVADIGFPRELLEEPTDRKLVDADWVGCMLPERTRACHKGDNGTVLIVAGSRRYLGAAALAARGALRAGAGLVMVASVPSVCELVAAQVPETIHLPLPEIDGVISPEAADAVLEAARTADAAVFGPGLTSSEAAREFLSLVWPQWHRPCCIDADALNAVAHGVRLPDAECVLTPHPGEMGRLMRCSSAEIQADRFGVANKAAQAFGKSVLLKGAFSIVASEGEPTLINGTGNPGMAAGGMGDVLSGIVGTLLAQSLPPYYAAACGAFWHGLAGDRCAHRIGSIGFTASEVANALPGARATIVEECDQKQSC
jgi:NAD(P)H-hydrate epimerase